jgi:hypothetical protein
MTADEMTPAQRDQEKNRWQEWGEEMRCKNFDLMQ